MAKELGVRIQMLFDRDIEPSCLYCRYGRKLGETEVACLKRGIVDGTGYCAAFTYEPTKRIPQPLPRLDTSGLSEEDFSL